MQFTKSKKVIVASLVLPVVVGVLIFVGVKQSGVYYLTVSEMKKLTSEEEVRVEGNIVPKSIQWEPAKPLLVFKITDKKQTTTIVFKDFKPDNFQEGKAAIIEGTYNPKTDTVLAQKVMTRCPSKYEKAKETK
ncbi:MAG: cytochrome c maturation protein CcmE [Actinomycetota bacterium]